MVSLSAANDDIASGQDTEATVAHTVSGADYENETAPDVTVTVPGLSVGVDETVRFVVPATGPVVVPAGTPVPAGTQVTLPSDLGGTIEIGMVAEDHPPLDGSAAGLPGRRCGGGHHAVRGAAARADRDRVPAGVEPQPAGAPL